MTNTRCEHCTKPFTRPANAPHKRFCSAKCRNDWHLTRRKEALKALAEAERAKAPAKAD